jgi:hypothetical protein
MKLEEILIKSDRKKKNLLEIYLDLLNILVVNRDGTLLVFNN